MVPESDRHEFEEMEIDTNQNHTDSSLVSTTNDISWTPGGSSLIISGTTHADAKAMTTASGTGR